MCLKRKETSDLTAGKVAVPSDAARGDTREHEERKGRPLDISGAGPDRSDRAAAGSAQGRRAACLGSLKSVPLRAVGRSSIEGAVRAAAGLAGDDAPRALGQEARHRDVAVPVLTFTFHVCQRVSAKHSFSVPIR